MILLLSSYPLSFLLVFRNCETLLLDVQFILSGVKLKILFRLFEKLDF